jgi:hypothetical protein
MRSSFPTRVRITKIIIGEDGKDHVEFVVDQNSRLSSLEILDHWGWLVSIIEKSIQTLKQLYDDR